MVEETQRQAALRNYVEAVRRFGTTPEGYPPDPREEVEQAAAAYIAGSSILDLTNEAQRAYGEIQVAYSSEEETPFRLGRVVMTPGIEAILTSDADPAELGELIMAHATLDEVKSTLDDEDKATNRRALKERTRVFSAFELRGVKVWIITEWDRSQTTILLPEEY